ncbi:MAG: hypothetical protein Q8R16_00740 [bacterium]|nr:hypothetical protein [bacterium]
MSHALSVILGGTLQFAFLLAILISMVGLPLASGLAALGIQAGNLRAIVLGCGAAWAQATLVLFLAQAIRAVRAA